jgi:hypothetical protein
MDMRGHGESSTGWDSCTRSARQILSRQHRIEEDLHTVCTCSVSLLHRRELRCCVIGAKTRGGIGGMVQLRQAGAFLLAAARANVTRHLEQHPGRDFGRGSRDGFPDHSKAITSRGGVRGNRAIQIS